MRDSNHPERGAALVETALAGIIFLTIALAVVDFGRMFHTRSKLQHAVGQATRYATTGGRMDDPDHPGDTLSREASMVRLIEKLSGLDDLEDGDVTIVTLRGPDELLPGAGGPGDVVLVQVTYRIGLVSPVLALVFDGGRWEFSCAARFRNEEALPQASVRTPHFSTEALT